MQDRINFNINFNFNELIYHTFRILMKNIFVYLKIFIIYLIPSLIFFVFSFLQLFNARKFTESNPNSYQAMTSILSFYTLILFLGIILIFYKLTIIEATWKTIKKEAVFIDKIILSNLKIFFPVLITMLMGNILISIGFFAFVFPAFIISIFFIYIPQIAIFDNKFFFKNLKKSFLFGFKSFWYVFLVPLIFYSLFLILAFIINNLFPDKNFDKAMTNKDYNMLLFETGILFIIYLITNLLVQIGVTIKFINIKRIIDPDVFI